MAKTRVPLAHFDKLNASGYKPKYYIAVASHEHTKIAQAQGFAQVCHGKKSPLNRMPAGDWIIYYSPKEIFGGTEPCQKFTAIGQIQDKPAYLFQMAEDFIPWRRDVKYIKSQEAPIGPLLEKLACIKNKQKWGFIFRSGLFEITPEDFKLIARAMKAKI